MAMRRFLVCSIIAALPLIGTKACVSEGPTHNRYMFSVYRRAALTDGPAYLYDISRYWLEYIGKKDNVTTWSYRWNGDAVLEHAQHIGDTDMCRYLKLLNSYLEVSETNSWDYPTKQQLATRRQTLTAILHSADAYKGTKLLQQYTLLKMRVHMLQGYNAANLTIWNNTASKFSPSPWREFMRNIYARALLKTGMRQQACDIYAEQGDVQSIRSVMLKYRNLAGIKSIFMQNPNSPTLEYLVQDFVNNVQETIDQKPKTKEDREWLAEIDAKAIYRNEAMQFVQFARTCASDKRVKSPSMWLAAASMTDYLFGNQQRAMDEADRAVGADGTSRMADNARAIRLLVSTRSNKVSASYMDYLLGEFRWLDSKIREERGNASIYDNHYTDVKDRVVHNGLEPLFCKSGMDDTALMLCAMMSGNNNDFSNKLLYRDAVGNNNMPSTDLNMSYGPWDEYFCKMDSLTADRLAGYYKYITSDGHSKFESYCISQTYRDSNYFNDLIGTKLIAEGRFADAMPYLERVSLEFLSRQRISTYSARRHFDTPRWFGKQRVDDNAETPVRVSTNSKLDFCRDMSQRVSQYTLARDGAERQRQAYDLAVHYYQASCYGDCWYLTHYYHSVSDSARSWEKDFANEAIKYLNVAKQSDDLPLRYHAIYALAYMPIEPWYSTSYDEAHDYRLVYTRLPQSAQYKALDELNMFAQTYPNVIDDYTRKCDVLEIFRKE